MKYAFIGTALLVSTVFPLKIVGFLVLTLVILYAMIGSVKKERLK